MVSGVKHPLSIGNNKKKSCLNVINFNYMYIHRHTQIDHHVVEKTALPDDLIKQAEGQVAFEETMPRV